ncbi:hypothetical protein DICVIV_11680 [Dictyocaulus viviparus]|uniref:SCP-like protein n=1 Tax=Dictyocaulus viviparus TaxID=29172 RepID=A0A0D8XCJ7_DICVI|nr:hypothetical protein DICVIV_11680 [Dictyocaulus viviparus]
MMFNGYVLTIFLLTAVLLHGKINDCNDETLNDYRQFLLDEFNGIRKNGSLRILEWNCTQELAVGVLIEKCPVRPPTVQNGSFVYGREELNGNVNLTIRPVITMLKRWSKGNEHKTILKKKWSTVGCAKKRCIASGKTAVLAMGCFFGTPKGAIKQTTTSATITPTTVMPPRRTTRGRKTAKPPVPPTKSSKCGNVDNDTMKYIVNFYKQYGKPNTEWSCVLAKKAEKELKKYCANSKSDGFGDEKHKKRQERVIDTSSEIDLAKRMFKKCWKKSENDWNERKEVKKVGCAMRKCLSSPVGLEIFMGCYHDNQSYDIYVLEEKMVYVIGPVYKKRKYFFEFLQYNHMYKKLYLHLAFLRKCAKIAPVDREVLGFLMRNDNIDAFPILLITRFVELAPMYLHVKLSQTCYAVHTKDKVS